MQISSVHRVITLFAIATVSLLVVSGFMVSESTGLPVPSWAQGGHALHRGVAGLVAVSVLGLTALAWRSAMDIRLKRLAATLTGLVFVQAALGMLLAKFGPLVEVSLLQAMLMHFLFAGAAVLYFSTRKPEETAVERVADELSPSLRSIAWWPAILVVAQIALGSAYRHGLLGVMPHLLGAFVIAAALAFLGVLVASTYPGHKALKRPAFAVVWLVALQIVLGLIALFYRMQVVESAVGELPSPWWALLTVSHIVVGSITFAATVWMAVQIRKFVLPMALAATGSHRKAAPSIELRTRLS